MTADLEFALALADLADTLTLPRFGATDLRIDTKPDLTPVTDADRSVERALRDRIEAEREGESVLGEEEGGGEAEVRWIVDPIDGTRNFARGVPVWATLLALERGGTVECGVVSAPALRRRWWAARGSGAWRDDGTRLRVSSVASLSDATVSCSLAKDLSVLEPVVWHARGFGDFWQHVLVAEGAIDACVDADISLWDWAALQPIVTEAGGTLAHAGAQVVSSNGRVHDALLQALGR